MNRTSRQATHGPRDRTDRVHRGMAALVSVLLHGLLFVVMMRDPPITMAMQQAEAGIIPQGRVEAFFRCHRAHISGGGFSDDRRDRARIVHKGVSDRVNVVVRQNNRIGGLSTGDTRRGRQSERRNS